MTTFTTERTARKRHQCSRCLHSIEPGERHIYATLPPGSELGNENWWSVREHVKALCPAWNGWKTRAELIAAQVVGDSGDGDD